MFFNELIQDDNIMTPEKSNIYEFKKLGRSAVLSLATLAMINSVSTVEAAPDSHNITVMATVMPNVVCDKDLSCVSNYGEVIVVPVHGMNITTSRF